MKLMFYCIWLFRWCCSGWIVLLFPCSSIFSVSSCSLMLPLLSPLDHESVSGLILVLLWICSVFSCLQVSMGLVHIYQWIGLMGLLPEADIGVLRHKSFHFWWETAAHLDLMHLLYHVILYCLLVCNKLVL